MDKNTHTEKILTFSSELEMFFKIERLFKIENFLFCSNQVEYKLSNKLLVQSVVYTYQKVVKQT